MQRRDSNGLVLLICFVAFFALLFALMGHTGGECCPNQFFAKISKFIND